ncbi:N-acetylmuramoyl-L-alanine amidase LytC precursor [Peptococcaceae bacterium CEB3]|nr:N-acetylmuramoyl-L-alanine amidase LytC precursor [Peptococcaceae bacterium CEB3]
MFKKFLCLAMSLVFVLGVGATTVQAAPQAINRFYGADRFGTAIAIAKELNKNPQEAHSAMFVPAYDFPDALSACTYATQTKEPILLRGNGVSDSMESLMFAKNMSISEADYVGGIDAPPAWKGDVGTPISRIIHWLKKNAGVVSEIGCGAQDRFLTNQGVVYMTLGQEGINDQKPSQIPMVIVNGYDFADALGIAPEAARMGWPIVLSEKDSIPDWSQYTVFPQILKEDAPSKIYVVGGEGVVSDKVISQVKAVLPNVQIERLAGADRFKTLGVILKKFFPKPHQIYLADGYNYPDALAGAPLAAANNAPIVLIDPNAKSLPPSVYNYLVSLRQQGIDPQINVFGGTAAVPDRVVQQVSDVLNGKG